MLCQCPKPGKQRTSCRCTRETQHQSISVFPLCALCVLCVKIHLPQPHKTKKGRPRKGSPHKASTRALLLPTPRLSTSIRKYLIRPNHLPNQRTRNQVVMLERMPPRDRHPIRL